MKKVTTAQSTWILMKNDFSRKVLLRQLVVIFGTCLLMLAQETIGISLLTDLD